MPNPANPKAPTGLDRATLTLAVVEYIGWYNAARLHESLGYIPQAEYEHQHSLEEQVGLEELKV